LHSYPASFAEGINIFRLAIVLEKTINSTGSRRKEERPIVTINVQHFLLLTAYALPLSLQNLEKSFKNRGTRMLFTAVSGAFLVQEKESSPFFICFLLLPIRYSRLK